MFGERVLRVERKTNLARGRTREMFMSISHVHEIFLEGVIVIIFESAWCKFASDQGDGWPGKTCESVLAKMSSDGGSTPKTRSQRRHKKKNSGRRQITARTRQSPFLYRPGPSVFPLNYNVLQEIRQVVFQTFLNTHHST